MVNRKNLRELSGTNTVENIMVFISDSTRFDYLPTAVRDLGVTAQAISPSTFTASSLPSLMTGTYPASHKVWGFGNRLPQAPFLLREATNAAFNVETIWSHIDDPQNKPPVQLLSVNEVKPLSNLESPFVYVEHDKGRHAPYGDTEADFSWNTAEEF